MAKVSLILDRRRAKVDGSYPLKLLVTFAVKQFRLPVDNISIRPEDWDNDNRCVAVSCADHIRLNQSIESFKNKVCATISILERSSTDITIDDIQEIINPNKRCGRLAISRSSHNSIRAYFSKYIDSKSKGTAKVYAHTLQKIEGFAPDNAVLEDVNLDFLRRFECYLRDDGISVNGINLHMRNLRSVINDAMTNDVVDSRYKYPFRAYKIKSQPTKHRDLTVEDIRIIRDFEDPDKRKYLDFFMLSFYMAGINIGDLCLLKKSDVYNGRIEYRRQKVNNGDILSIKIEPEMQTIIDRYAGSGEYLLSVLDTYSDYHHFLHRMNRALKAFGPYTIGYRNARQYSPLYPFLSTYYARHTFATLCTEDLDIDESLVDRMLGHAPQSLAGKVYIRKKNRKQDKAIRKLIDYVNADR